MPITQIHLAAGFLAKQILNDLLIRGRRAMLTKLSRFACMSMLFMVLSQQTAYAQLDQLVGENYIRSDEGEIVLFALPGCEVYGKKGLYGHAVWKTGVSEIVCWNYDNVIYIHTTEGNRTLIFDPDEVRTRGVNQEPVPSYSVLSPVHLPCLIT